MCVYFRLDWLFTEILIETARIEKWKREIASIAHRVLFVFFFFFWFSWILHYDRKMVSMAHQSGQRERKFKIE